MKSKQQGGILHSKVADRKPDQGLGFIDRPGDYRVCLVWGSVLVVFLGFVIFALPEPISTTQQGILRFFIALAAGLFAKFFVGGVVFRGRIGQSNQVSAGGGFVLFILAEFVIDPLNAQAIVGNHFPNIIASNATVQSTQGALKLLGRYSGPVNGVANTATRDAIRLEQQAAGMATTGILDNATFQYIDSQLPQSGRKMPAESLGQQSPATQRSDELPAGQQAVSPAAKPRQTSASQRGVGANGTAMSGYSTPAGATSLPKIDFVGFYFLNGNDPQKPSNWIRVNPTTWHEIYPNGHYVEIALLGGATVDNIPGLIYQKEPSNNEQVFIPSPETIAPKLYWRDLNTNQNWVSIGLIRDPSIKEIPR